jgi:hypothetical protein
VSDRPCVPLVPAAMQHALVVAHAEVARLRARVAELEARVVKLPKRLWCIAANGGTVEAGAAEWDYEQRVKERLDAAGVKWEEE